MQVENIFFVKKCFGQIRSRYIFLFPNYVLHRLDTRLLERKILIIKNRSFFSSNILIRHLTFKSDVNIKQTFERLLKILRKKCSYLDKHRVCLRPCLRWLTVCCLSTFKILCWNSRSLKKKVSIVLISNCNCYH